MNPDDMRAGRMLAQGDLRLVALALIAQAPRHGYEIIKLVERRPPTGTARVPASSIQR
jgi:DNA-binding PadR family transcriptional regulator